MGREPVGLGRRVSEGSAVSVSFARIECLAKRLGDRLPVTADARELADRVVTRIEGTVREWLMVPERSNVIEEVAAVLAPVVRERDQLRAEVERQLSDLKARAQQAYTERSFELLNMTNRAQQAERDCADLRAQLAAAKTTLQLIVDKWDCRTELFISDEETAQNLADTARIALDTARREGGAT